MTRRTAKTTNRATARTEEKVHTKESSRNRNTEKRRNKKTMKVNVKMKMNILSKTIGIIIWIAMILMKGNIIVGKKNRWTKWITPTILLRNAQRKR